jgi:hypothetical protein
VQARGGEGAGQATCVCCRLLHTELAVWDLSVMCWVAESLLGLLLLVMMRQAGGRGEYVCVWGGAK